MNPGRITRRYDTRALACGKSTSAPRSDNGFTSDNMYSRGRTTSFAKLPNLLHEPLGQRAAQAFQGERRTTSSASGACLATHARAAASSLKDKPVSVLASARRICASKPIPQWWRMMKASFSMAAVMRVS